MFTKEALKAAHAKVKSGADFPKYISDIRALGVRYYDTFVSDGRSEFHNQNGERVISDHTYKALTIADTLDAVHFKTELAAHQQGKTDYPTFCQMCAETGIEKWVVDLQTMTCTYFDKAGTEVLQEQIPGA